MPNYNYGNNNNNNNFIPNNNGYYGNNNTIQQNPIYANSLLTNSPYNNYMGINNNNFQNQNQTSVPKYLKCRPVSSQEEARACQIDLDGSLFVFTDVGNKKVYTKQVNANGLAVFNVYTLDEESQVENIAPPQFVTKEEFDKTVLTLATAIKEIKNPSQQSIDNNDTLLDIK